MFMPTGHLFTLHFYINTAYSNKNKRMQQNNTNKSERVAKNLLQLKCVNSLNLQTLNSFDD